MLRVTRWLLPVFAVAFFATSSFAQFGPPITYTESASGATAGDSAGGLSIGGIVQSIPTSVPLLYVASDGEVAFDPFGVGFDTSDAIVLNSSWVADNSGGAFNTGFWTQVTGTSGVAAGNTNTWVLPASTPCGTENEPTCEPLGIWYFGPGSSWLAGTPSELIFQEAGGGISDTITLDNHGGPSGTAAEILFQSDPIPAPEPGTLVLLGAGLLALGGFVLRHKQVLGSCLG